MVVVTVTMAVPPLVFITAADEPVLAEKRELANALDRDAVTVVVEFETRNDDDSDGLVEAGVIHRNVLVVLSRSDVWRIEMDAVSFFLLAEDGNTELVIVLLRVGLRGFSFFFFSPPYKR